jgi:hypothetical protein
MSWEIKNARSELARLSQLKDYPSRDDQQRALEELVLVLYHNGKSAEHAEAIVSEWLEEFTFAPKPADLRRLLLREDEEPKRSGTCNLCCHRPHSPGWLHLSDGDQSTSARCICRGGNPQLREQAEFMIQKWRNGMPEDVCVVTPGATRLKSRRPAVTIAELAAMKSMPKLPPPDLREPGDDENAGE